MWDIDQVLDFTWPHLLKQKNQAQFQEKEINIFGQWTVKKTLMFSFNYGYFDNKCAIHTFNNFINLSAQLYANKFIKKNVGNKLGRRQAKLQTSKLSILILKHLFTSYMCKTLFASPVMKFLHQ